MVALLPAAGSGSRMKSSGPKQYTSLAGKPMLWHSVRALTAIPMEAVFVVLAPDDAQFRDEDWSAFGDRLHPLWCGGESRRDSVCNGLVAAMAMVDPDDWVLVHDAARPCLPKGDLARLVAECENDPVGGLLAIPAADTVKRAGREEAGVLRVERTEDRATLWLAQTPQMFRAGLLLEALRASATATDEASAVEARGHRPRIVAGSRDNLKVTYPEDVGIAEAILARRG